MSVEKICEYFNEIGILQLEDMNRFLKIYSQISQNKLKNKSDKIILSLFSYISYISKNEKQLYEICKNIVNNFSNNQILHRYRGLYMMNNIFKSKIHSRFISFLYKLIFSSNKKHAYSNMIIPKLIKSKSNTRNIFPNVYGKEEYVDNVNYTGRNKIINNRIKKGKIIKKYSGNKKRINNENINENIKEFKNNNNICKSYDFYENKKENIFSPKRNKNKNSKINSKSNENINDEINYFSTFSRSNLSKSNSNIHKKKSSRHLDNYSNNNKINEELEKMIENISKYNGNPSNMKYIPKKTIYRTEFNPMYTSDSYTEMPFYSYPNIKINKTNNYFDEDYDFYQNEEDHIKKVQDKIFQLKLKKMDKISRECTFNPEINEVPRYLYENMKGENNYNEINLNYENNYKNNIYNINYENNLNNNSFINSRSFSKKKRDKFSEEFIDEDYNIYPQKRKNFSKDSRSYSNSKGKKNEFSIYKAKKEELMKQLKEQYPFMPSIKGNKNFEIKSTFDERQRKFIEEKRKKFQEKQEEEQKEIEEMKKFYNKQKANIKELVNKLYDKEAEKIKERLKKEKEEKSKKKKVIDWDKRNKENREKYPEEYQINYKKDSKQVNNKNLDKHLDNLIINLKKEKSNSPPKKEVRKSKSKEKNLNKKKKNKTNTEINKDNINKNKQILIEKIKDEHVIGFKNGSTNKQNKYNNFNIDKNKMKENKNNDLEIDIKTNIKESENININNSNLLGINNITNDINKPLSDEMKSKAMKQIMNQIQNK